MRIFVWVEIINEEIRFPNSKLIRKFDIGFFTLNQNLNDFIIKLKKLNTNSHEFVQILIQKALFFKKTKSLCVRAI
jgi:hypothetical protein